MDDLFEKPIHISHNEREEDKTDGEDFSSGEDENMDWSKLPSISRPVIPKRGEKDFEPSVQGGSGYQRHILDNKRKAMFQALGVERNTSSKTISHGIWDPSIARAHVTVARGIHFTTMGHAVARNDAIQTRKLPKRLELLPEEALYLIERGAMFTWKAGREHQLTGDPGLEEMVGEPMTVQQAFSEMIGMENLTLEKYQVYAYLKRLGYVVMRTTPPSVWYPSAAPFGRLSSPRMPIWEKIWGLTVNTLKAISSPSSWQINWWKPLRYGLWLHHNLNYPSVFSSLRSLIARYPVPLVDRTSSSDVVSPYEIFYNIYKPATPFKKTSPPAPDFSIVVVDARTTPMPTLSEFSTLFDLLPELPPPEPRKRMSYADQRAAKSSSTTKPPVSSTSTVTPGSRSLFGRFLTFIYPFSNKGLPTPPPVRKPNPFAVLKAGKKLVVIAAVDAGTISFFGFRQGAFEEFPMM